MDPEVFKRVSEIFAEARHLQGDARLEYLEKSCDGDDVIRREVEVLLSSHDDAQGILAEANHAAKEKSVLAAHGQVDLLRAVFSVKYGFGTRRFEQQELGSKARTGSWWKGLEVDADALPLNAGHPDRLLGRTRLEATKHLLVEDHLFRVTDLLGRTDPLDSNSRKLWENLRHRERRGAGLRRRRCRVRVVRQRPVRDSP